MQTLRTVTDCRVLGIERSKYANLVDEFPVAIRKILTNLLEQAQRAVLVLADCVKDLHTHQRSGAQHDFDLESVRCTAAVRSPVLFANSVNNTERKDSLRLVFLLQTFSRVADTAFDTT